ncbi:unnamed protein product, partial [Penicillium egyptiacum]
ELGEEQALSPVILSNANAQAESSNSSFQSPYTAATNASIDSPENTAELGEEQALSPVILSNANAQAESSNSSF